MITDAYTSDTGIPSLGYPLCLLGTHVIPPYSTPLEANPGGMGPHRVGHPDADPGAPAARRESAAPKRLTRPKRRGSAMAKQVPSDI